MLNLGRATNCNIDSFQPCDIAPFVVGTCTLRCYYCNAFGYSNENKGSGRRVHFGTLCCNQNKVSLPHYPDHPEELQQLFNNDDDDSKYFRLNIRKFISGLAMASLQVDDKSVRRYGPSAFKICGQLHRIIGTMISNNNSPKCLQVYFYDEQVQSEIRASRNRPNNDTDYQKEIRIFRKLQTILQQNNTYLRSFITVNEYITNSNHNPEEISFELHATDKPSNQQHPGRFHLPSAPEIALLLPGSIPENSTRTMVCSVRQSSHNPNNEQLVSFPDYHKSYDPLAYPLFFPHGTDGWSPQTKSDKEPFRKVSLSKYLRYYLMKRSDNSFLHKGNRLFQQFITDQYGKSELQRLRYIESNQKKLRADLYKGVEDSITNTSIEDSGRTVILPSTFTGSDRWYQKNYQNSMALVRKFGKPDLL